MHGNVIMSILVHGKSKVISRFFSQKLVESDPVKEAGKIYKIMQRSGINDQN